MDEAERVTLHEFPLDIQLQIINAHPRLGAQKQTLSLQSYKEQGDYDLVVFKRKFFILIIIRLQ